MKDRKILLKCVIAVCFVTAAVVGIVMFSYLLRPITVSRKNICGFYAEEKNTLDVVYIGGSAVYTYWEGLQAWNDYGYTSYNFATDAIQPQVLEYVIEEILKSQEPELLLIDLRPFQYGDELNKQDGLINMNRTAPFRNVSDNFKFSTNRIRMIENTSPSGEEKWTYHFELSKYHSLLGTVLSDEQWKYTDNEEPLYTKGFWPREGVLKIDYSDTSDIKEMLKLEEPLDSMFKSLLAYCNDKNLKVLFVVHNYQISKEDQMKYNYMESLIEEYGHDYLNANDYFKEIGLNVQSDFYDYNHVNLIGADKYTNFLAKYIHENYELQDHRSDPDYQSWNECYAAWSAEMQIIRDKMQ